MYLFFFPQVIVPMTSSVPGFTLTTPLSPHPTHSITSTPQSTTRIRPRGTWRPSPHLTITLSLVRRQTTTCNSLTLVLSELCSPMSLCSRSKLHCEESKRYFSVSISSFECWRNFLCNFKWLSLYKQHKRNHVSRYV